MIGVCAPQVPAVVAEVRSVLDWAEAKCPGPFGPYDGGGLTLHCSVPGCVGNVQDHSQCGF